MKSAEVVKKIRLSYLVEQSEFANLIGMSKQAVWQYEKGIRRPRLITIRKLLELAKKKKIEVTIEDFME